MSATIGEPEERDHINKKSHDKGRKVVQIRSLRPAGQGDHEKYFFMSFPALF